MPRKTLIACPCIPEELSVPQCLHNVPQLCGQRLECRHCDSLGIRTPRQSPAYNFVPAIFLANHQLRSESRALPRLATFNSFSACKWSCAFQFFQSLHPAHKASINHIRFWATPPDASRQQIFSIHFLIHSLGLNRVTAFVDLDIEEEVLAVPTAAPCHIENCPQIDIFFDWKYSNGNLHIISDRIRQQWNGSGQRRNRPGQVFEEDNIRQPSWSMMLMKLGAYSSVLCG